MYMLRVFAVLLSRPVALVAVALLAAFLPFATHAQANAKSVDSLLNEAQTALSKGRPEEATSLLRRAIDQAPDRAELYLLRSRARDSSGKFDAALDDANKYIELKPDDPVGYLNRLHVYRSLDKKEKALEDANKAIALAPNDPDGYFRRSDLYSDMSKDAEAKADEAKADALDKQR